MHRSLKNLIIWDLLLELGDAFATGITIDLEEIILNSKKRLMILRKLNN